MKNTTLCTLLFYAISSACTLGAMEPIPADVTACPLCYESRAREEMVHGQEQFGCKLPAESTDHDICVTCFSQLENPEICPFCQATLNPAAAAAQHQAVKDAVTKKEALDDTAMARRLQEEEHNNQMRQMLGLAPAAAPDAPESDEDLARRIEREERQHMVDLFGEQALGAAMPFDAVGDPLDIERDFRDMAMGAAPVLRIINFDNPIEEARLLLAALMLAEHPGRQQH